MLAFVVRNLPFAYVVMYPTLARIGEELDRAGRASGAGWWRTCRSIVLPLLRPAIFSAFVLMFVEILNDYDPALFLVKPGNEVMGTTMLSQFIQGPSARWPRLRWCRWRSRWSCSGSAQSSSRSV